jgi:glycosyl transferase family 87
MSFSLSRRTLLTSLALAALAIYVALVALPIARTRASTFASYYVAAHVLAFRPADMSRIYDDDWFAAQVPEVGFAGIYAVFDVQPPTMSLIVLPLVWLPPLSARLVWTLLGPLWLLAGLVLLARALGEPAIWGLWALPVGLAYGPTRETIYFGQVYLLLFFLLCVVFWALARPEVGWRSEASAGLAVGLMLILKTAGAWLWPLLFLAGRWRALICALVTATAVALISLPWIGAASWMAYIARTPELATAPRRFVTAYQTTTSLFGHLLVYDPQWNPTPVADAPLLARALTMGVLLLTLALSVRWGRLSHPRHGVRVLTLALFTSLMVTSAPLGEGYHYALALPALLVAAWWAWRGGSWSVSHNWVLWGVLALAALLMAAPLPYQSPALALGWLALLAYPRVYGAYLLWLVLALMLKRAKELPVVSCQSRRN